MEDAIANRGLPRTASVHEDWIAWLPEEKDRLFDAILSELEISYGILSVSLDDARHREHRNEICSSAFVPCKSAKGVCHNSATNNRHAVIRGFVHGSRVV